MSGLVHVNHVDHVLASLFITDMLTLLCVCWHIFLHSAGCQVIDVFIYLLFRPSVLWSRALCFYHYKFIGESCLL